MGLLQFVSSVSQERTAVILRTKLQNKRHSHSILTPDRPVLAMTLKRQKPGRAASRIHIFKSLV